MITSSLHVNELNRQFIQTEPHFNSPKASQLISTAFPVKVSPFSYVSLTGNYVWPRGKMGVITSLRESSPQSLYGSIYCALASIK